jgi:hypothetical protein
MSMKLEPIKKASKVVGVILTIMFSPKPKRSQGGAGPNLIDFSTRGNKVYDVGGEDRTIGLNIYHSAD